MKILMTMLSLFFLTGLRMPAESQPVLSSKRVVEGFDVFADFENPALFYYSPPEIVLNKKSSGAPAFTLLQMRYTGSHLYSDQQVKAFHNILQIAVVMESVTTQNFDAIKQTLGRNAQLKPLPIRQFQAELIIPLGDAASANEKYRRVNVGGVETTETGSSGNTFWHERTYSMQLENYEAQLLWDQIETGKLGVSFYYAFYSEAMPGIIGDLEASGDRSEVVDEILEDSEEATFDKNVNTYLVKANTFPISIDVTQWPDCLKKVDVNEELPPAYASFEVRCYDFTDNLRPDLLKKIVEIKAYAAGKEYITVKRDFLSIKPDVNSLTARFPYAIRLDHPIEYRIIEINALGEKITSEWLPSAGWHEVIDITTPQQDNKIGKRSIDFELDLSMPEWEAYTTVSCEVEYKLNGESITQRLSWSQDHVDPLRSVTISFDKAHPIRYRITGQKEDNKESNAFSSIPTDTDYVFLKMHR